MGGRYTLVYMPPWYMQVYTTLGHMPPLYTLGTPSPPHAVTGLHHGYTGTTLRSDKALGSTLRLVRKERPLRVLEPLFLLRFVGGCAQSYSCSRRIKHERLDSMGY